MSLIFWSKPGTTRRGSALTKPQSLDETDSLPLRAAGDFYRAVVRAESAGTLVGC